MKKIIIYLLLVIISISNVSCLISTTNKNEKVRIGYFPNMTHSQALLGKAEGKFQVALNDTEVEWKMFNAGPSELEAILAGEIDIAYIGSGPTINGYVKSKGDIQIIAGATKEGAILISRKGANIDSVRELENKKVAVPQFGNTQDLILRYLLMQNGLKDITKGGKVEIKQVNNSDLKVLLEKGDIDAALVPEPWGTTFIKDIDAHVVLDYNTLFRDGNYSTALVIARKDFIKNHQDIVEKFLKTHIELTNTIIKNDEYINQTINNEIGKMTNKSLSTDVFNSAFDRMTPTYDPEKDSIEDFIDLSVEVGTLKEKVDTKDLFNLDILNRVLKDMDYESID